MTEVAHLICLYHHRISVTIPTIKSLVQTGSTLFHTGTGFLGCVLPERKESFSGHSVRA